MEDNKIELSGKIVTDIIFEHEFMGEKFYTTKIEVVRDSGNIDTLPLMISSKLLYGIDTLKNKYVWIDGMIRTYNCEDHNGIHLKVVVFVDYFDVLLLEDNVQDTNNVEITGYICKKPTYRKTPQGREISDIHIAINRTFGKSDYIPCVVWGRNARYSSALSVGDKVNIKGRLQSRTFVKHIDDDVYQKIAYELSVKK